ncbi:flavodoxin family protein [Chloroflexota bacterium]
MKILGIVGSPRKGSSTDQLVTHILEGAKSKGAEVEKLYLRDYNISHCQGAQSCEAVGKCVIPDDMELIVEKLREATGFVLGSPVLMDDIHPLLIDIINRSRQFGMLIDNLILKTPAIEKTLAEEVERRTCYQLWKGTSYEKLPSPVEDIIFNGLNEYEAKHGSEHPSGLRSRQGWREKKGVLALCYWQHGQDRYQLLVDHWKWVFEQYENMKELDAVVASRVGIKAHLKGMDDVMERAFKAGQWLCED